MLRPFLQFLINFLGKYKQLNERKLPSAAVMERPSEAGQQGLAKSPLDGARHRQALPGGCGQRNRRALNSVM